MANKQKKPVQPVVKPFLTGDVTDERTKISAASLFGVLLMVAVMSFLVCSALSMKSTALRILLNGAVELLALFILYNSAISRGAEAVARGEILYQKKEKGQTYAESERKLCFHPLKGYMNGLLACLPFFLCAAVLAVIAKRQMTGIGTLPSWLSGYQRRSDIGGPLVAYTAQNAMTVEDILRIIVRIVIMPFVSMVGTENKDGMLLLERLSPLIMLLPAAAYGTGYLRGRQERTKIHTGIAESKRARARKERKAQKKRAARQPRQPEQLN